MLRSTLKQAFAALPASWRFTIGSLKRLSPRGKQAIVTVTAPEKQSAKIAVITVPRFYPNDLNRLLAPLRELKADAYLIGAAFLSPRSRQLLLNEGICYADDTGNIRIVLDHPTLFIARGGATKNPSPDKTALQSLKGSAAGRVIRALCDNKPPYGVRELAERSATPPATVSRVAGLLARDVIVQQEERGKIKAVDWQALIRRWCEDYDLAESNQTASYLEPRGIPALIDKLPAMKTAYATTGSLAAVQVTPMTSVRQAVIYVEDIEKAAEELKLKKVEAGANVMLAEPFDPVVFERTWQKEGVIYAALSQVAADLLTSPGRGTAEADALMRWMEDNPSAWRS